MSNGKLAVATANGQADAVQALLDANVDPDELGPDGTSPLCAAALWGNSDLLVMLIKSKADVNQQNAGTQWTALHAAAFQEHGKVCHLLLLNNAKASMKDATGCTPADFASISESIWPFFAAKGAVRSSKADLLKKGIIRKTKEQEEKQGGSRIKQLSRPGSAYVRVQRNPFVNSGSASVKRSSSFGSAAAAAATSESS